MKLAPMNTRCRIERKVTTQDAVYGTEVIAWQPVCVVWCHVQDELPSRSAESVRQGLALSVRRARLRMFYRTDIDASMRVIICRPEPIYYQIIGGPAELGTKAGIEMMLEEFSTSVNHG